MKRIISALLTGFMLASSFVTISFATTGQIVTEPENQCNYFELLAQLESNGRFGIMGGSSGKYAGAFQMGESALITAGYKNSGGGWTGKDGITSMDQYLGSEAIQKKAVAEYTSKQQGYLQDAFRTSGLGSAESMVGQSIPGGCSSPVNMDSLMGGAHLMGAGGVTEFFKSGGFCGWAGEVAPNGHVLKHATTDGKKGAKNSTCLSKRMCQHAACDSVAITKDMSKDTCVPTMKMIDELSCSNFPSNLQGFCNTNKPFLMTRGECSAAEANSKASTMGPNKEQCENLSFGPGTGSWSFVLACSYAGDFVADQDGESNPSGPISDPACVEKLKGMGLEVRAHGDLHKGSTGGKPCIVENAVTIKGKAVPFPAWTTMTCDLAVAMEQWGQKIAPLGVTGYEQVQTISCRPMVDKRGERKGTISEHGLGRAADIPAVMIGGRRVSMGMIHQPMHPDGALILQIKAAACSTFRGVLSPTYEQYKDVYAHFHVEWGRFNGCR